MVIRSADHGSAAPVLVEACVTTVAEAVGAAAAGARRLELCRELEVGGLTPPRALVGEVLEATGLPVFVMVRPTPGPFRASTADARQMLREASALVEAGAHGIVAGILDGGGGVEAGVMRDLVHAAEGRPVTFHRAFDEVRDPVRSVGTLVSLGVARVLTSGGAATAWEGRTRIARLVQAAAGGLTVMAGGGVRGDHVTALVEATGVGEVHARASAIPDIVQALSA